MACSRRCPTAPWSSAWTCATGACCHPTRSSRARPRWTSSRAFTAAACARRSCSTSRASAAGQARTSRSSPSSTTPSRTSTSSPAAACAPSTTSGPSKGRAPPARSSRPRCTEASSARASWPSCADQRLEVRDERGGHVGARGLLQPPPAGDAVELEDVVAAVRGPQHVDPRVVDAEDLRRLQAQTLLVVAQLRGLGSSAAREGGAPPRADPLDRRQHPPADDQRAQVAAVVGQRLLQVVDRALELQRVEDAGGGVGAVPPRHPRPHRAEQRLDDDVAAELLERLERVVGAL